jgi:tRNA(His) 5'-end guanylyltransferase
MVDLKNHLFETLEALKDDEKPMDLKRAAAINVTARNLIEMAKVEVSYIKATGADVAPGMMIEPREVPARPRLEAAAGGRR